MALVQIPRLDSKKQQYDDGDNIYYNIAVRKLGLPTPADGSLGSDLVKYRVTRLYPVLKNPEEYELAITRFNLPASNIPIQVWQPKGQTGPYQPDPDLPNYNPSSKVDKYLVTLRYNDDNFREFLTFAPNSSGQGIYGDTVFNYQEILDFLNKAFLDAFTALKATYPGAPPTEAPYAIFDSLNQQITIVAQTLYDTGDALSPPPPATIEIYFNDALFSLFPSNLYYAPGDSLAPPVSGNNDGLDYQFLVRDVKNNTNTTGTAPPYYYMYGEYPTIALWNDFQSIIFTTDNVPTSPEFESGASDTQRILTDFIPDTQINNREAFQFTGVGFKRYYDLPATYPLRAIDLQAYWRDVNGTLYPIYIRLDEEFSMKILFRKKEKYKN